MKKIRNRAASVLDIPADVEDTRTIPFIISTEARDRHGTVLRADKWELENYRKNPIIAYQHNLYGGCLSEPNPDNVIGRSEVEIIDKQLIGRAIFEPAEINELAEKIFRKILHGTLRAASVGFLPLGKGSFGEDDEDEGEENETYYFERQELLEWSIVNIPSNPEAHRRELSEQGVEVLFNIQKLLGEDYSISDIKKMEVEEVIKRISGEWEDSKPKGKTIRERRLQMLNLKK